MSDNVNANFPSWLKAAHSGAIGEARARALLLERFWVLDRSVDIHGADLFIQRRITGKNLLDREAPRLGVVQVKFFGTPGTSHFVHKEYVLDDTGSPREEFFVFCYTGNESDPRLFVMSGKELHEVFPSAIHEGHAGYRISYKQLVSVRRLEVTVPRFTLDRIERQLELAEFTKNRRFLSWALPSAADDVSAIEPMYREPIDNWWGDISVAFERLKKAVRGARFKVEEIHDLLAQVSEQTDPLLAEEILDRIRYHCRDGYGRWSIGLPDGIWDPELFDVCRRHKRIVDSLRADGLLDRYLEMKEVLRRKVLSDLEPLLPIGPDVVHQVSMTYDSESLLVQEINTSFRSASDLDPGWLAQRQDRGDWEELEMMEKGLVKYRWWPGRYRESGAITSPDIEFFKKTDFYVFYKCLDAVFSMRYDAP